LWQLIPVLVNRTVGVRETQVPFGTVRETHTHPNPTRNHHGIGPRFRVSRATFHGKKRDIDVHDWQRPLASLHAASAMD
jgi:hypothetical protein